MGGVFLPTPTQPRTRTAGGQEPLSGEAGIPLAPCTFKVQSVSLTPTWASALRRCLRAWAANTSRGLRASIAQAEKPKGLTTMELTAQFRLESATVFVLTRTVWWRHLLFHPHSTMTTTIGTWCPTWCPPSPTRRGELLFENSVLRRAAKARSRSRDSFVNCPGQGAVRGHRATLLSGPHNHLVADNRDSDSAS